MDWDEIKQLRKKERAEKEPQRIERAQQAPAWSYTVNGQSFDCATQCWTENGVLLCDAEDGTRLKVDSYTPVLKNIIPLLCVVENSITTV